METSGWIQLAIYSDRAGADYEADGALSAQVLDPNGRTWLDPVLRPLERGTYRVHGRQI